MAKKKKKPPANKITFQSCEQEFSFDIDAIIFMAVLGQTIRSTVEEIALDMSENKKCIPKSTIVKAVKSVGLGSWIDKMPVESSEDSD